MSTKNQLTIDISTRSLWRIVGVAVVLLIIVRLQVLIFYLLFALLFAIALDPMVSWLEKHGLKRGPALALVLLTVVGLLFALLGVIISSLVSTIFGFLDDLPSYIEGLRQYSFLSPHIDSLHKYAQELDAAVVLQKGVAQGSSVLAGVSKVFEATLFTFFFTVYMLLEREYLLRIIHRLARGKWKSRTKDIEKEFISVVGGYIRGQVLTSCLVGLSSYIFFRLLGVPNAFALATIAGLADIIPVIGGLIGVIPAVLISLTISPVTAVVVVILMQGYSTINNYFIQPKVYGSNLDMSPFIVTIATMTGLLLFGIPGIILALPAAAILGYIVTKYYNIPILETEEK